MNTFKQMCLEQLRCNKSHAILKQKQDFHKPFPAFQVCGGRGWGGVIIIFINVLTVPSGVWQQNTGL